MTTTIMHFTKYFFSLSDSIVIRIKNQRLQTCILVGRASIEKALENNFQHKMNNFPRFSDKGSRQKKKNYEISQIVKNPLTPPPPPRSLHYKSMKN